MPEEFRHIIRIADTDLDGTEKVAHALANIKGIGIRLANVIVEKAGVDPETRLGFVPDAKIEKIEDVIANPSKYGVPGWLLNRPKDIETGKDRHLIGPDLALQIKSDIEQMKNIKSWSGFRHAYGLRVRGQRTKTTGRTKKALGVKKALVIKKREETSA
jgi:small subunit ribosomal protein S13